MAAKEKMSRREWVKTVAIVFLVILLLLTFFSNTIMNYSLPEVAVSYVSYDSITAKVKGTGTVESEDPYEVRVDVARKVKSVAVREGSTVSKDDVLVYFEEAQSDEIENAKKAYEDAKDAYDKALLSADVTSDMINEATSGSVSTETYRNQITNAQNAVNAAQKEADKAANASADATAVNNALKNMQNAKAALDSAKNTYDYYVSLIGYENDETVSGNASQYDAAYKNAYAAKINAEKAYADAETAYNTAKNNLDRNSDANTANYEAKKAALEAKQAELSNLVTRIGQVLAIRDSYEAVQETKEAYDKAKDNVSADTVVADRDGTISSLSVVAGQTTDPTQPLMVITPADASYTLSFSTEKSLASRANVGDIADISNSWWYTDVTAVLSRKRVDPQNPSKNVLLEFKVTGDVADGTSLTLSVGQSSQSYDYVVPNNAIHEDNDGKFVLTVEVRSTPLGNRYIARRKDVEVIISDDVKSAVKGDFQGWEYVITTSTKPIQIGDQVRLADDY
ncbi:MAG: HlyD family secretion protein [Acetatifactor sp.]|nr:HlyD family secretion protein [Acetatifactor sp.]